MFISIRIGASVCHERAVSVVPRGAFTGCASVHASPLHTPRPRARLCPTPPLAVWDPRHAGLAWRAWPPVPAASQTLRILDYLAGRPARSTAAAIVRDLGLPRSTVTTCWPRWSSSGFVTHLPEDRRYALGLAAYELGTGYARQAPLARVARVPLAELVDRTGHSAHLAVLHGREVVYVLEERAPGRPPLVTDVGVRLPAQLTASGRAMLAAAAGRPDPGAVPRPGRVRAAHRGGAPLAVGPAALLVDMRRRGYAVEDGEVTAGFASLASPVLDHSGHPVAGVALTFPAAAIPAGARERAAGAGGPHRGHGHPAHRRTHHRASAAPPAREPDARGRGPGVSGRPRRRPCRAAPSSARRSRRAAGPRPRTAARGRRRASGR